jgi:O-methyltransferase
MNFKPFSYLYPRLKSMSYYDLLNILEVILLAAVFVFLFRFVFMNYTSKVRKPQAWTQAVRRGEISRELLKAERKYADRIRFYNLWLQAERLKRDGIEGSFAELGVYKGETARLMHLCAPEKTLHLFDTFEGFPATDLKDESGKAAAYTTLHFADTGLEKVKRYLGEHPEIVYHQGYFQESIKDMENEKFALVSLDADLHKPTKAGLEFFYPRLSPGGVIMIHDYNTDWPELMKAVDTFCTGIPESLVPVPDADSTVMILKSDSR